MVDSKGFKDFDTICTITYNEIDKRVTKYIFTSTWEGNQMDEMKILKIKESVYEGNDKRAAEIRKKLKRGKKFLLNIMSSPGSGKTSTIIRTIELMKNDLRIGVMEADIDSDVDAKAVQAAGAKAIQIHTGGMCHLKADMTKEGLDALGTEDLDLIILENIGNLLCPAEFDTGAVKNAMILSVPEGDDKPLKYPHMFSMVDVLLVSKIDMLQHFDFDMEVLIERVRKLNENVRIIPVSARTGEGIEEFGEWLKEEVTIWQA